MNLSKSLYTLKPKAKYPQEVTTDSVATPSLTTTLHPPPPPPPLSEVASKKLWCRPRVLVVFSPYSRGAVSLVSTLTAFLHHTAAIAATNMHTNLADAVSVCPLRILCVCV